MDTSGSFLDIRGMEGQRAEQWAKGPPGSLDQEMWLLVLVLTST